MSLLGVGLADFQFLLVRLRGHSKRIILTYSITFQFLLVRLREAADITAKNLTDLLSIPSGAIKSQTNNKTNKISRKLSIPSGAIKRK